MTKYFNDFDLHLQKMIFKSNDDEHILQLNYAYLISCMETYLSSSMWGTLKKYPKYYNDLGKGIDRSVKLKTILQKGIPEFIEQELNNLQYHNLAQVKIHYKNAFNVNFPENLKALYHAIQIRHDIVHRCGISKNNLPIKINLKDVQTLKHNIVDFIKYIDNQMQKI